MWGSAPINLGGLFDVFMPIHAAWWAVFGQTLSWGLSGVYHFLAAYPVIAAIGAYGLAIVVLTIIVRLLLAPLFHLQLRLSRRSMEQQKKIAPQLAEVRKKYKSDPQKQQQEMMALYRERGIDPLIPGLPIPTLVYRVIPLLAAGTTFAQSRMMQQPLSPVPTEQEQQTQQMTRTMQVMMPLMIAYFAIVTRAGLGLYWFVSNCFSIIQQYFVNGWGGLRPPAVLVSAPAPALQTVRLSAKSDEEG